MSEGMTYKEMVGLICEFLEVAIHYILYQRHLYPAELFERRKIYNTYCFQSRHPALNTYIKGIVDACGEEIARGVLTGITLVVLDDQEQPVEKHLIRLEDVLDPKEGSSSSMTTWEIQEKFRNLLQKLSVMDGHLSELSQNCTFGIVMNLLPDAMPVDKANEPPPWIAAQNIQIPHPTMTAIKTVDMGLAKLQYLIQGIEAKDKQRQP